MQTRGSEKATTCLGEGERNSRWPRRGASNSTARKENSSPKDRQIMEAVVARENMVKALNRVERNKGAAGVDDMTAGELRPYLKAQWPRIKEELLEGKYMPQPVRRVEIAKRGGGDTTAGYPHGGRSTDPTGTPPGVKFIVRPGVFGIKLWISFWPKRSPGDEGSRKLCTRREEMGSRCGLRQVL